MASIRKTIPIGTTPDAAWDALRDFGALHERLVPGFVTDTKLDGDDRVVTFANGAVARERLVAVDDTRRRLVYSVVESALPFAHHQAAAEIVEADGAWQFVWTADVLPDEVAPIVAGLMDDGAAAIERALAG